MLRRSGNFSYLLFCCDKIVTIALIRQIRQLMSGNQYKFSFSIGREKWEATEERAEVDWPKV